MAKIFITNFRKNITYLPTLTLTLITAFAATNLHSLPTSADDYISTITINVEPACTLSNDTDPNQTLKTLQPGTYDDNIHTFTLTSNCNHIYDSQIFAIGYSNNEDGNTNLIGSTTNEAIPGTTAFENDPTNFTTSGWFMKVSPDETNVWQFSPQNDFNNFHTIPNESTLIAKTSITTNKVPKPTSTLTATYSTYASPAQPADTYEGKVKYTLTTSQTLFPYIQDLTLNQCKVSVGQNGNPENVGDELTAIDIRDGNDYTVRYINGYCWMTQNLRITGTIKAEYSNFTGNDFDLAAAYDLSDSGHCNYGSPSDPKGFENACYGNSGLVDTGVWYNFVAATAGSVTGYENYTDATQDICPANWHLPTGLSSVSDTNFYKLIGNTSPDWADWQSPTTGLTAFAAVDGGAYIDGTLLYQNAGYWWSATSMGGLERYRLFYESNANQFSFSQNARSLGFFVRCVRTS